MYKFRSFGLIKFIDNNIAIKYFTKHIKKRINNFCLKTCEIFKLPNNVDITIIMLDEHKFIDKLKIKHTKASALCEGKKIYINAGDISRKDFIEVLYHEIVHCLLNEVYGLQEYWVSEGCAIYFSGQLGGLLRTAEFDKLEINKYSIKCLENNFDFSFMDYLLSGIYIKYIYETQNEVFYLLISGKIKVYDFEKDAISFVNA